MAIRTVKIPDCRIKIQFLFDLILFLRKMLEEVTPLSRVRNTNRVSVTDRVVTEAEGAGPTVEKWRVCLKRTAVEWKHRTQSRRDRAGA